MLYAYARVSTDDQDLSAQREALLAAGAGFVFEEKVSGARIKRKDRKALDKALGLLRKGDTLLVTRLDRLARSTLDLLNILDKVAQTGATFKSLADTWADTTTPHGKLMVTVLGGLAEFERELIRDRTGEGRTCAMAKGVRFGRPHKLTQHQVAEAIERRTVKGESLSAIAKSFNVSHPTIMRVINRAEA